MTAQAQVAQQRVIVFDFVVDKGIDPSLSAKAADAIAAELTDTQLYDVVTRQTMEEAITTTRGLTFPLDRESQLRIARLSKVEATSVFTGRVRRASAQKNRGVVELDIYQMDVASEELVNGARVSGDTGARDITDPGQLVDAALLRASYEAVREMERTVLPEGTILVVDSFGEVTLNVGIRQGVRAGQLFTVTRREYRHLPPDKPTVIREEVNRVGTIKVISVEANQSTARIVWARRGAQTGDRVRQIFALSGGGGAAGGLLRRLGLTGGSSGGGGGSSSLGPRY
jgi:hypothetical protein